MNRRNATRNALVTSVVSLLLCVTMLLGTTFAWFTDSVTSANNIIKSGNLDIELDYYDGSDWVTVEKATQLFTENLWEPGHTEVVYLRLTNVGSLALNYQLGINIVDEDGAVNVAGKGFKLSDYIQFGVVGGRNGENNAFATRQAAIDAAKGSAKALKEGYSAANGMMSGDVSYMALVVYMPEEVDNEANYRGSAPQIELGINVHATQKANERDSFGNNYDAGSVEVSDVVGGTVTASAPQEVGAVQEYVVPATSVDPEATPAVATVATMNIAYESVENPDEDVVITVTPTEQDETVAVSANEKAVSYEITVTNIKDDNDKYIEVELFVGKGLTGVKVFHNNVEITDPAPVYNSTTGYVSFKTKSFSPFTVVYNSGSISPLAEVKQVDIDKVSATWGMNNQSSAHELDLDVAYSFKTTETADEAKKSPYRYWHADFVVYADKDVPAEGIALAGYYQLYCNDFNGDNWVALKSDEVIKANTEIRLLHTLMNGIQINYEELCEFIPEFSCGAADLTGENSGTTLTVELRMYETTADPTSEDGSKNIETGEYEVVGTYTYTFE